MVAQPDYMTDDDEARGARALASTCFGASPLFSETQSPAPAAWRRSSASTQGGQEEIGLWSRI
jgi:hypothetical protein